MRRQTKRIGIAAILVFAFMIVAQAVIIPIDDYDFVNFYSIFNVSNITADYYCNASGNDCHRIDDFLASGSGDITAVNTNGPYLLGGATSGGVSLLMNESFLNNTIDSRASGSGNCSGDESCENIIYYSNQSNLAVDTSDNWDNLDTPADITGSEFWYNTSPIDQAYADTNDADTTYTNGSGLSLVGTEFNHTDTSSQASSDNSGNTFIQDVILDTFGHITSIVTAIVSINNIFDQNLNTTDNVIFNSINVSSLTEGSVLFAGLDGSISQNNANFFWNDSSGGLVLGGTDVSEIIGGVVKDSILATHSQGGNNAYDLGFHRHSATSGTFLAGFRSRGSEVSPSIVQDGDNLLDFFGIGYDGTDYEFSSSITLDIDGTPSNNNMPGMIRFFTTPNGSTTVVERLRIDSTGLIIVHKNLTVNGTVFANDWTNVSIIETQISDLVHTTDTDTNASTICSGTTTYLDGEGNCDDISSVYSTGDHVGNDEITLNLLNITGNDDNVCGAGDFAKNITFDNGNLKIVCDTPAGGGDITGVLTNDIYIYNGSASGSPTLAFNESRLNDTIDNRDADTTYTAGSNLSLIGTIFSLNATSLQTWLDTLYSANTNDGNASSICSDDEVLLGQDAASCVVLNATIDDRDSDTTYTAGSNLSLIGTTFSVNNTSLRTWLDTAYSPVTWGYNQSDLALFWDTTFNTTFDQRDSDTTYTSGSNLSLIGTVFSLNTTSVQTWLDTIYEQLLGTEAGLYAALSDVTEFVETNDAATLTTLDTGEGANELFDMDQNVLQASDVLFNTVNSTSNVNLLTGANLTLTNNSRTFYGTENQSSIYWDEVNLRLVIQVS